MEPTILSLTDTERLLTRFSTELNLKLSPNYTASPGELFPIVINTSGNKILPMRWGIRPEWAIRKHSPFQKNFLPIEELTTELEKNKTRERKVKYKRCLIPVDIDSSISGLAGVYEQWFDENGTDMSSFAIITHKNASIPLATGVEERWLDQNFKDWNILGSFLLPR